MRPGFLLDPDVAYLNHGSYGACPAEVFEEYQRWQRELETDPHDFFTRRFDDELWNARAALAAFVGARVDDLVFVPNATSVLCPPTGRGSCERGRSTRSGSLHS